MKRVRSRASQEAKEAAAGKVTQTTRYRVRRAPKAATAARRTVR